MTLLGTAAKRMRAAGDFFAMVSEAMVLIPQMPFAWREFLLQTWFVARVTIVPTITQDSARDRCRPPSITDGAAISVSTCRRRRPA